MGPLADILRADRLEVSLDAERLCVDLDDTPVVALAKVANGRDLLEGIDIQSELFEDWLRRERTRLRKAAEGVRNPDNEADGHVGGAMSVSVAKLNDTASHQRDIHAELIQRPILVTETRSTTTGLDAFIAESIVSQLGRTATEHSRISVTAVNSDLESSVIAPGSRCVIRVTPNDQRMMALARLTREPSGELFWSRQISFSASDELEAIDAAASLALEATEALASCSATANSSAIANAMAESALQDVFSFDPKRLRGADALLEKAHSLDPLASRPALRALSKAYLLVERSVEDPEHTREEVRLLIRDALELDPDNAIALAFIGDVYDLVFEDPHMALSFVERALRINPGTGYAHASLGGLELRRGRGPAALSAAARARRQLENTSLQVFSLMRYCLAAMHMGEFSSAAKAAEKAAFFAPTSRPPLRHLYLLRLRTGDRRGAREALTQLRKLEPDFSIARLRDDPNYPAATIRSAGLHQLQDIEV